MLSTKPHKPLSSIKTPIEQHNSDFIYTLSPLVNKQPTSESQHLIQNTYTRSDDGFLRSGKLTKALLDPSIFIDKKDSSIDQ